MKYIPFWLALLAAMPCMHLRGQGFALPRAMTPVVPDAPKGTRNCKWSSVSDCIQG